ncbi:hypothetical protein ACOZDE_19030 [Streptomyces griseoincarnatus]
MNDTTEGRRVQLGEDRLVEIRDLVQQLGRPDQDQAPRLLADARTALLDLLADRDDLVRANDEAAEELALWTGAL